MHIDRHQHQHVFTLQFEAPIAANVCRRGRVRERLRALVSRITRDHLGPDSGSSEDERMVWLGEAHMIISDWESRLLSVLDAALLDRAVSARVFHRPLRDATVGQALRLTFPQARLRTLRDLDVRRCDCAMPAASYWIIVTPPSIIEVAGFRPSQPCSAPTVRWRLNSEHVLDGRPNRGFREVFGRAPLEGDYLLAHP